MSREAFTTGRAAGIRCDEALVSAPTATIEGQRGVLINDHAVGALTNGQEVARRRHHHAFWTRGGWITAKMFIETPNTVGVDPLEVLQLWLSTDPTAGIFGHRAFD